jgi:hypothetical protein
MGEVEGEGERERGSEGRAGTATNDGPGQRLTYADEMSEMVDRFSQGRRNAYTEQNCRLHSRTAIERFMAEGARTYIPAVPSNSVCIELCKYVSVCAHVCV